MSRNALELCTGGRRSRIARPLDGPVCPRRPVDDAVQIATNPAEALLRQGCLAQALAFAHRIVAHQVCHHHTRFVQPDMPFGGAFLAVTDLAARTVAAPAEIPIGVVTALLGGPFFALVLRTTRRVAM